MACLVGIVTALAAACGDDTQNPDPSGAGGGSGGATGVGGATGAGGETGAGGATGAGGSGCTAKTMDASGIDGACQKDDDCPTAYVCQAFNGVVVTYSCQILCTTSCDCPTGHSCMTVSDQDNSWTQCTP
jgi:hypothetical protein